MPKQSGKQQLQAVRQKSSPVPGNPSHSARQQDQSASRQAKPECKQYQRVSQPASHSYSQPCSQQTKQPSEPETSASQRDQPASKHRQLASMLCRPASTHVARQPNSNQLAQKTQQTQQALPAMNNVVCLPASLASKYPASQAAKQASQPRNNGPSSKRTSQPASTGTQRTSQRTQPGR